MPHRASFTLPWHLARVASLAGVVFFAFLFLQAVNWPADDASLVVIMWWALLCAFGVANIVAWFTIPYDGEPCMLAFRRRQSALSLVFVVVCAFRGFLPRADVQKIVLVDSWWSSVLVGRSLATIAEICFMLQWILVLRLLADAANSGLAARLTKPLLPAIILAESCSWYAVVTTNFVGNVVEQSLWTLSVTLVILIGLCLLPRLGSVYRGVVAGAIVFGVGYVFFMLNVDIPMYYTRWVADSASGREYLGILEGFRALNSTWHVTFSWQEWKEELAWMVMYFGPCVWVSMSLAHMPAPSVSDYQRRD